MTNANEQTKSFDSLFFIRALPNEYLVKVGKKDLSIVLGGSSFKLFKKHLKVPGSAETTNFEIECSTSNYLGINVSGYVEWRINPETVETAIRTLDFYNIENPLQKTSNKIHNMAKDAVRRVIATINVENILKSSEVLKESIEKILEDVSKWGLIADSIGISEIFIRSENVYNDMQAGDRNKLKMIAEMSSQETESKISQDRIEKKKEMVQHEGELRETEIRNKMQEDQILQEAEIEKERLKKEQELEEIKLSRNIEKDRYDYQKIRLTNDAELQDIRLAMDEKNIDLAEKKRLAEEGMTDREIAEMVTEKIPELSTMYRDSNITIIGDKSEALGAFVTPIQALSNMVKDLIQKPKTSTFGE